MRRLFAFAITAASALAQSDPQKVDPRWFLPREHERLAVVDFAALRETDFFACLHPEVIAQWTRRLDLPVSTSLARVDRLTWVGVLASPGRRDSEPAGGGVLVLSGNGPLGDAAKDCEHWATERLGGFDVYWLEDYRPELRTWPKPDLFVCGTAQVLRPLLQGPRQPGLPCADVLSLSAGRDTPLAFVAGRITEHDGLARLGTLMPEAKWAAGKVPTHFSLRLCRVPDPDEEGEHRIVLRGVVRHATGDAGVAETEAAMRARIRVLLEDRRLKLLHELLRGIVVERDGIDVNVRIDCGREREAAGLASLAVTVGRLFSLLPGGVDRREFRPPGIRDIPGSEVEGEVPGR